MSATKKRVNKTKEELHATLDNEAKKQKIRDRMEALKKLEDELGCVFVPLIQYSQSGSQTYIAPFDAPKEEGVV